MGDFCLNGLVFKQRIGYNTQWAPCRSDLHTKLRIISRGVRGFATGSPHGVWATDGPLASCRVVHFWACDFQMIVGERFWFSGEDFPPISLVLEMKHAERLLQFMHRRNRKHTCDPCAINQRLIHNNPPRGQTNSSAINVCTYDSLCMWLEVG